LGFISDSENNLSQTPDSRLQTKDFGSGGESQPELNDDKPPRRPGTGINPDIRAVAIATLLTGAGVKRVTAFHPDVAVTWSQDERVTDELLLAAVAKAKESLGDEAFQTPYLRPIVVELLNPKEQKAPKRDEWAWAKTKAGIEAEGRAMGMFARGSEDHYAFAERIKVEKRKQGAKQ
jgi:hypothetical protein